MTRTVSLICIALIVFTPLNVLAADSGSVFSSVPETEVRTTSPLSPVSGHGLFKAGAQAGELSATVATAGRTVDFHFDRGRIVTADHYSFQVRILENDANVATLRVVARKPSGESAMATVFVDKKAGVIEKAGFERVQTLLNDSADFTVLRSVLPDMMKPENGLVANDSCLTSVLALAASLLGLAACETIIGCIAAGAALIASVSAVYDNCSLEGLGGSPVGVTEPPCTSMSIC